MKRYSELSAGIFLLLAVLLFSASIFLIGQERKIFSRQVPYYTSFLDVKGLAEGAPVRLGGITVGRVARISFPQNPNDPNIELTLYVDAEYTARIRRDTEVSIETQGLLGDKFLSLTTGASSEALPVGGMLKHREASDISQVFEKAGRVVDTTVQIADNVNNLVKDLSSGTLDNFSRAAKNIADLTEAVQNGDGFVHRLVYHKEEGEKILTNLEDASATLNKIFSEIQNGQGALHALIFDPKGKETVRAVTAAARNLAATSEHLSAIASEIRTGKGLAHDLIYGESKKSLTDILQKLDQTAANLKRVSEALAQGSGTLGALLVDSRLYDNLVEVTDGAKRSFILREAIKSSLKEGEAK